ncbi:MAG: hypothetical protein J2P52_00040 [Blastocatellia bacterium]|nr:hypothetical protein [Blastocatellia bacterium]
MKRAIIFCSLTFIFSLCAGDLRVSTASGSERSFRKGLIDGTPLATARGADLFAQAGNAALGQSAPGKACPFIIAGMWKVEGRTEADALFYSFSADGWVNVVSHSANALPREYEVIAQVKYELDNPSAPRRVEFTTERGNDAFLAGKTSLEVIEYDDDSFVTENPETHDRRRWVRAQTHRYFLSFAASGGGAQSAFAMITILDGRGTKIEALGLRMENREEAAPIFGPIPERLYQEFEYEGEKDSRVTLRLELTEAEFERAHQVFETWAEFARTAKLPHDDPYLNGMEFLKSAAESLNQCDNKLKLDTAAGAATMRNSHQQTLEFIRMMRKKNENLHVTNGMFPADWRPTPLPN